MIWVGLGLSLLAALALGVLIGRLRGPCWERQDPIDSTLEAELRALHAAGMPDYAMHRALRDFLREYDLVLVRRRWPVLFVVRRIEFRDMLWWSFQVPWVSVYMLGRWLAGRNVRRLTVSLPHPRPIVPGQSGEAR
ncbi:MAG: hypothetical protein K2Q10_12850 [Rhodospirillales bacterium]|nr:hypothetical protein [Rhodospirillales bacterium]